MAIRTVVHIDESKCNGCGQCIPSCAEGALTIVDGKARLVKDVFCDGLGACLGECPRDAITLEQREAEAFDKTAVREHLRGIDRIPNVSEDAHPHPATDSEDAVCNCPGAALRILKESPAQQPDFAPSRKTASCPVMGLHVLGDDAYAENRVESEAVPNPEPTISLLNWPVQLNLLPVRASIWENADVLVSADCVAFATPEFHRQLLAEKTLAIACPKLDEMNAYINKLTNIFQSNPVRSVTVAIMEVPCCNRLAMGVRQALSAAGKHDVVLREVVVTMNGKIQTCE